MPTIRVDKSKWKPAQHRIWERLRDSSTWYAVNTWPAWAQRNITLPHKSDSQAYNLFVFLVANGLSPSIAGSWLVTSDVKDGKPVTGRYSIKELGDIDRLKTRWSAQTLVAPGKRVFDLITGRPEPFDPINASARISRAARDKTKPHPFRVRDGPRKWISSKELKWRRKDPIWEYTGRVNPYSGPSGTEKFYKDPPWHWRSPSRRRVMRDPDGIDWQPRKYYRKRK